LQGVDRKYSRTIRSVAFSPDGQLLASAVSWTYPEERGRTGTVELWDVEGGKLLRTLGGYFNKVSSVAFSPDGQLLASIGGLGESAVSPQLWQVEGWELLCTLERQVDEDNNVGIEIGKSVTFSSEGRLLASSAGDHTVQLWGLA